MRDLKTITSLGALLALIGIAACVGDDGSDGGGDGAAAVGADRALPQRGEHVELDPAELASEIDNPYLPLTPGSRWVYRETEKAVVMRVEVTVTDRTRAIDGITARVVRDVVSEDGAPVEVTDDWYAQDAEGNVWYLGEATTEYEDGKPASTEGSFEHGVDGAEAGIAMPADPRVGSVYRQEDFPGEAEDYAEVLSLDEAARVPFGSFEGLLMTEDVNPLQKPKPAVEHKLYARDVGLVLAIGISGGSGREELVTYTPGS